MLTDEHRTYLLGRGYDQALLEEDQVQSVRGDRTIEGIYCSRGDIAWPCRTPAGSLIGIQVRSFAKSEYWLFPAPDSRHLPPMFGSAQDHEILFRERKLLLTEGILDRVALKRCLPGRAVYARLSRGVSRVMTHFLKRHTDQVTFAFDMDQWGADGTERAGKALKDLNPQTLEYPAKDPSELLRKKGVREAANILLDRMEFLEAF